jgi:hypothetical protein
LDIDVLGGDPLCVERELLTGFLQLLASNFFVGLMVGLESIEDELVVGNGVDGVVGYEVEFSMDASEAYLADAYDTIEEWEKIDIGLEEVGAKHGALLAVLNAESEECSIKGPKVDIDAVNGNARLEFLLEQSDSTVEHALLEGVGVNDKESNNQ